MTRQTTRSTLIAASILIAFGVVGCAPQTRFVWGDYETSLYDYYKNPSDRGEYEKALTDAIAAGQKQGKVAPGLCAELGYMRLEDGDTTQARVDFEEEMHLFPESRPFLTGVISRMTPGSEIKSPVS